MRTPQDIPRRTPRATRRGRLTVIVVVVVIVVLVFTSRALATFFTDYLWFGSVHFGEVWHRLFMVKLGLFVGFAVVFFILLWVNLAVVDRLAPAELSLGPEDELVRRYQSTVAPHALLVRNLVALLLALIGAAGAIGQWQNYLLFRNGVDFVGANSRDPQFGRNIGWFVFKLPFLSFIVGWAFVALVVAAVVTLAAHYLNGGIRIQAGAPRVSPQVKAHVSVLLALIALVKVVGYYLQQYGLDLSCHIGAGTANVCGASKTDVAARLPAIYLLMLVSIAAVVILLLNIWRKGWALPVLAVGLWAFVALVVGAIVPAIYQALKVSPAQSSQSQGELKFIQRNINATRQAMNLDGVQTKGFAGNTALSTPTVQAAADTLNGVRLWDPGLTAQTYTKLQATKNYYSFNTLALDRYTVNGVLTPEVVGAREVNDGDLPSSGWVNTHLQYTHGYGMFVSPANQADGNGQPVFTGPGAVGNVPPVSGPGLPNVSAPSVYFGVANPANSDAGYVLVNSNQSEIDYQETSGKIFESKYSGSGGVQLNGFLTKTAFAVRFGDAKLLISDQITPKSRIMFVRDVTQMATKAAPFLSYDSDPYPVLLANGHIDWILDAYTTSANYPYAQPADTTALSPTSGLANQNFNYVRNSVKVVVDAYSGQMIFYVMDPNDPVIQTWEKIFPTMFKPGTGTHNAMSPDLQAHIRYPEDIFTVQAAAYGRYHITTSAAFYNAGDQWAISQSPGAGPPDNSLATTQTTNAQGQAASTGQLIRMSPLYENFALPGSSSVTYNLIDAFVPVSGGDQIQTLSGFLVAGSDPDSYGKLTVYQTPRGQNVDGPALINARIGAQQEISSQISLLNKNGSAVLLGNVQMVPVSGAMLYFRPLYVESTQNPLPVLTYVIVAATGPGGTQVVDAPTLPQAVDKIFPGVVLSSSTPVTATGPPPTGPTTQVSQQIQNLITTANTDYNQSETDLKALNYAAYGTDLANLKVALAQLAQISGGSSTTPPTSTTTTAPATTPTTTVPATTSTTTGVASRASRARSR